MTPWFISKPCVERRQLPNISCQIPALYNFPEEFVNYWSCKIVYLDMRCSKNAIKGCCHLKTLSVCVFDKLKLKDSYLYIINYIPSFSHNLSSLSRSCSQCSWWFETCWTRKDHFCNFSSLSSPQDAVTVVHWRFDPGPNVATNLFFWCNLQFLWHS